MSATASKYPTIITPDMLPQWAHISNAELAVDAVETLAEIKLYERLGRTREVEERCAFVAFLHALTFARSAARPTTGGEP